MLTGDNAGHRRPILSDTGGTVTAMWAFPFEVSAGDTYTIYPGCDKKFSTCQNVYNNATNFRGFLGVPKVQETIM